MKEKNDFLKKYLAQAPIFLAMERASECRLISKVELKRPILDFGCGDGLFSSILFSEPTDLGIDISLDELRKSSKRGTYRNLISGDLSRLPLKTESFNTIICNSVMEHVLDFETALREAYKTLSPGGKFIITLPTENYEKFLFYPRLFEGFGLKNIAKLYRQAVNRIFKHHHAYATARWIRLMEDHGFKIIKTTPYFSRKVMTLSDFYLPFSFISWLNKKIFKRWILWPAWRKHFAGYLERYLRKAYFYQDSSEGACLLIEAQRV